MEGTGIKKEKKRLTPISTVLLTLLFTLLTVIVSRAIFFIITGV